MAHASFIKKPPNPTIGFDILNIIGLRATAGDVGLEIECEGNTFNKSNETLPKQWEYHQDGSLRGQDNAEYVLRKPIKFAEVPKALDALWADMAKHKTVLSQSMRTSVHVHLNCQSFHLNRLASFCTMYFAVEEILTEWCGDHRVGNLFCLRAKDAPNIITQLRLFIQRDGNFPFGDGMHYAGLNASALGKFGSLEVRTLRGVTDPSIIQDWVDILQRIYELSGEYPDPREIIGMFSAEGPMGFLDHVLGPNVQKVLAGIEMSENDVRDSLYEGIRYAQDIAYSRDWSQYVPQKFKPDPFDRDAKKMARRIANAGSGSAGGGAGNINMAEYMAELDALANLTAPAPAPPLSTPNSAIWVSGPTWPTAPESDNF